jgi:hypothetical protein
MAHPEDEAEDETRDWTPEGEAARDPSVRANKLLDKVEKKLDEFTAEAPAAPIRRYATVPGSELFAVRSQIEVRKISNGFILSYSRAKPVLAPDISFEVYEPIPVEAYILNATQAAQVLYVAMAEAEKIALSAQRIEAHQDAIAAEFYKARKAPAPQTG